MSEYPIIKEHVTNLRSTIVLFVAPKTGICLGCTDEEYEVGEAYSFWKEEEFKEYDGYVYSALSNQILDKFSQ